MTTSPGSRDGSSVLEIAKNCFPFQSAVVKGSFSLPSFYENFNEKEGITNTNLNNELLQIVKSIIL